MLGVLVPVLCLDGIARRRRFTRKGEVPFVIPAWVYGRSVLPLLPGNVRAACRLPASVRSVRAVIHDIHLKLILPRLPAAAPF